MSITSQDSIYLFLQAMCVSVQVMNHDNVSLILVSAAKTTTTTTTTFLPYTFSEIHFRHGAVEFETKRLLDERK